MLESVSTTSSSSSKRDVSANFTFKRLLALLLALNICFLLVYTVRFSHSLIDIKSAGKFSRNNSSTPETELMSYCKDMESTQVQRMTSTQFSTVTVFLEGARVIVNIETFDKTNTSKLNGGDVILIFAVQTENDGRVPGTVVDHDNGSYTGILKVFWRGTTKVYLKLASSIENTCIRLSALEKYGNIVYTLKQPYGLRAKFVGNESSSSEMTPCNTNDFIYGSSDVCNFTKLNGGMSWYCGHPTRDNLSCKHLRSFSLGPFSRKVDDVSDTDKIQDPGHGMFKHPVLVSIKYSSTRNTSVYCSERNPVDSWKEPAPSGYYLNKRWILANCQTLFSHTISNYRKCLRTKTLILLGDSTVRQYANFFIQEILNLTSNIGKGLTFGPNFKTYHGLNTFKNHKITIIYRKQALPLHFSGHAIPVNDIMSFPQILDEFATSAISASSIIILLNYHTHFSAFPPERYRERLRHLADAIKRFLEKKPSAKVFFKGPSVCISNSKWWDPRISKLFYDILKEEFTDLMNKVVYLNVWDIAVAHNVEDVHPQGDALKSQIHQFMSLIC